MPRPKIKSPGWMQGFIYIENLEEAKRHSRTRYFSDEEVEFLAEPLNLHFEDELDSTRMSEKAVSFHHKLNESVELLKRLVENDSMKPTSKAISSEIASLIEILKKAKGFQCESLETKKKLVVSFIKKLSDLPLEIQMKFYAKMLKSLQRDFSDLSKTSLFTPNTHQCFYLFSHRSKSWFTRQIAWFHSQEMQVPRSVNHNKKGIEKLIAGVADNLYVNFYSPLGDETYTPSSRLYFHSAFAELLKEKFPDVFPSASRRTIERRVRVVRETPLKTKG